MDSQADLPAVLLLEGDLPTAELYRRELSCDCSILMCLTEAEAWSAVEGVALAAAVVEPSGLGAQGWEIVSSLAARRIPVIVCSTLDERKKGLDLGASHYLVKPVLPSALLKALRDVL